MTIRTVCLLHCALFMTACAQQNSPNDKKTVDLSVAFNEKSSDETSTEGPKETVDRHSLNERAADAAEKTKYEQAETLLTTAINVAEAEHLVDRSYSDSLSYLGRVYYGTGRYAEAEALLRRALEIDRQLDKESESAGSESLQRSLNNLAAIAGELDYKDEAESLLREAAEVSERLYGPVHPEVAISLNNLAVACRRCQKLGDAERFHKRALQIREQTLDAADPAIATSLANLGMLYHDLGRLSEAEEMYLRAIAIQEKGPLVESGSSLATSISNLAFIRKDQHRIAEAEALFHRSLQIKEDTLGLDHPSVGSTLYDISDLLSHEDRLDEIIPILKRSLAIQEKVFGRDSPKLFKHLEQLAYVQFARREFKDSESFMRQQMTIGQKTYGDGGGMVAATRRWIAWCLEAQGRFDLANSMRDQAVQVLNAYPVEDLQRREALRHKAIGKKQHGSSSFEKGRYFDAFLDSYDAGICFELAEGLTNEGTADCREQMASSLKKLGCDSGANVLNAEAASIRVRLGQRGSTPSDDQ